MVTAQNAPKYPMTGRLFFWGGLGRPEGLEDCDSNVEKMFPVIMNPQFIPIPNSTRHGMVTVIPSSGEDPMAKQIWSNNTATAPFANGPLVFFSFATISFINYPMPFLIPYIIGNLSTYFDKCQICSIPI